jgi:hypothetical protein
MAQPDRPCNGGMCKRLLLALMQSLLPALVWAGPALTEVETRWLQAGSPVLAYALAQRLPLDVVVQPQARPGDVPFAMAYIDGRCKLVLSMRGRAEGDDPEALLHDVPPELRTPIIEAMTAHELAHCWRHVQGAWQTLPAGFAHAGPVAAYGAEQQGLQRDMRQVRREEGFADLVGLAWTADRHPGHYTAVHAWFTRVREVQPVAGAHHDTRAWLRRVADGRSLGAGSTPFDAAWAVWLDGLRAEE